MEDLTVSGLVILGRDLETRPARIVVREGRIASIEDIPGGEEERWICPGLYNAHTHLGDAVAMDLPVQGTLEEMVTPPHGLKHRILRATGRELLIGSMRSLLRPMLMSGTHGFCDFREGGSAGVSALQEALQDSPLDTVILGRDGGESAGDGAGIAGTRDIPDLGPLVEEMKRQGKIVGIHAGERDPDDIGAALALDPDFLVHCTHATEAHLHECADRTIPIVVCPRSNWALGVADSSRRPPLRRMQELGCTVFLGTDNAMFVQPDLLQEMSFCSYAYHLPASDVLHMAVGASEFFGSSYFIEKGAPAHLLVIDPAASGVQASRDPLGTIVKRLTPASLERNVICSWNP